MSRVPQSFFVGSQSFFVGLCLAGLWLAIFWPMQVVAQTGGVFATDSDAPISIQADKMTLLRNGARAELLGNAALAQGPLSLTARAVTLFYSDAAPRSLTRITAAEEVHIISQSRREVFGDTAVYLVSDEQMTVSGNVRVIDTRDNAEANTLTGARLVINMRDGTSRITGAANVSKNTAQNGEQSSEQSSGQSSEQGSGQTSGRARIQLKPNSSR
jgi:lipopolysaccharide export system protein LptA